MIIEYIFYVMFATQVTVNYDERSMIGEIITVSNQTESACELARTKFAKQFRERTNTIEWEDHYIFTHSIELIRITSCFSVKKL